MGKYLLLSKKRKKTAKKILESSGLLETLSQYGEVNITGSLALGVFLRPDIDIYVVGKEHNYSLAKAIAHEILNKDYFDMLCFVNHIGTTFEKKLKGYYLQPHKNINKVDWKIDVWLTIKEYYKPKTEEYLSKIKLLQDPDKAREMILRLKQHFRDKSKYKGKIDGETIYDLVLENPNDKFENLITKLERKI